MFHWAKRKVAKSAEYEACVVHGQALGLTEDQARACLVAYIATCDRRGLRPDRNRARELLLDDAMRRTTA